MPGPRRCFATAKALQCLNAGLLCEVLGKFPDYLKERKLKLPAHPTQDNLDYDAIRAACMYGDMPADLGDVLSFVSILGTTAGWELIQEEAVAQNKSFGFPMAGLTHADLVMKVWLWDWPKNKTFLTKALGQLASGEDVYGCIPVNSFTHPGGPLMSPTSPTERIVVLAAAAHPDDIEFMMAGTLLLLKETGADIHMWNLANGHCGTARHSRAEIIRLRAAEAEASARLAGAVSHPPLFDDLDIFYDRPSLARVAAVVREVRPSIILTHSPQDYMEDHQNTCRLVVTAAFSRGMRNFVTDPTRDAGEQPVALYHALPHGIKDGLGQPVRPDLYIDIGSVLARKRDMLACHRSQKEWLDVSQGMDAYLNDMVAMSATVGRLSGRFAHAEGWRRHSTLGFAPNDFTPVENLMKGKCHATTAE